MVGRIPHQKYLDWQAALARVQARFGLIPREAAGEIGRMCKVENIGFDPKIALPPISVYGPFGDLQ
jgi:hypothetical protein